MIRTVSSDKMRFIRNYMKINKHIINLYVLVIKEMFEFKRLEFQKSIVYY
jgi:hypothetical protein